MSCRVHGARRSNLSGQGVKHADKAQLVVREDSAKNAPLYFRPHSPKKPKPKMTNELATIRISALYKRGAAAQAPAQTRPSTRGGWRLRQARLRFGSAYTRRRTCGSACEAQPAGRCP